ncbi:hypothetical protein DYB28_014010 [Aphanomyces astaci]|uniref:t-SNARE coiled-coil homology domain-containing protein n=1 Tax=Aphanomyces astaci TaxID=112090 RepID=A0A9X8H4N3_APHAT|nr:hypothetical protein DYB28_014010 [Aphanomyces astaci]
MGSDITQEFHKLAKWKAHHRQEDTEDARHPSSPFMQTASVLDSYKLCEQRVGELKLLVFPAHGIPQQVVKVRSEVVHYLRVEKQVHDIQGMMHQFASEIGGQAEKMHVVAQEAEAAADNVGHGNLSLKHAADHGHGFGFAIFCCYLAASTLLLFFHYY